MNSSNQNPKPSKPKSKDHLKKAILMAARVEELRRKAQRGEVKPPYTKTDEKNLAAKQDFGGDDFKLEQPTIVDPDTLAREKREKEEADAAQGDLFGGNAPAE